MKDSNILYRNAVSGYLGDELTTQIKNFKKAWVFFHSLPADYIWAIKDYNVRDSIKKNLSKSNVVPKRDIDHIGAVSVVLGEIEEDGFDNVIQNALTNGDIPKWTFRDSLRNLLHLIKIMGENEEAFTTAFDKAILHHRKIRSKISRVDLKRLDLTRLTNGEILQSFDLLLDQHLLSEEVDLGKTRDWFDEEIDRRGLILGSISVLCDKVTNKIIVSDYQIGDVKQDRNYGYVPTPDKFKEG